MLNRADIEVLLALAAKNNVSTLEVGPDGSLKVQFRAPSPVELLSALEKTTDVPPAAVNSGDSAKAWLDFQPPAPPAPFPGSDEDPL